METVMQQRRCNNGRNAAVHHSHWNKSSSAESTMKSAGRLAPVEEWSPEKRQQNGLTKDSIIDDILAASSSIRHYEHRPLGLQPPKRSRSRSSPNARDKDTQNHCPMGDAEWKSLGGGGANARAIFLLAIVTLCTYGCLYVILSSNSVAFQMDRHQDEYRPQATTVAESSSSSSSSSSSLNTPQRTLMRQAPTRMTTTTTTTTTTRDEVPKVKATQTTTATTADRPLAVPPKPETQSFWRRMTKQQPQPQPQEEEEEEEEEASHGEADDDTGDEEYDNIDDDTIAFVEPDDSQTVSSLHRNQPHEFGTLTTHEEQNDNAALGNALPEQLSSLSSSSSSSSSLATTPDNDALPPSGDASSLSASPQRATNNNPPIASLAPLEVLLNGLANFRDIVQGETTIPSASTVRDIPVFWHIPKSGGSSIKDIIGTCHKFVLASEFGVTDGHAHDTELAIVYPTIHAPGHGRSPFVNVDTTTADGIRRAARMGFATSGLADAVVTPLIYEAHALFAPESSSSSSSLLLPHGRLFAVFRHPMDRAISMFYYVQVAHWEKTYNPALQSWSLEDYARSTRVENNWMTRILTNTTLDNAVLTDAHLAVAIKVVQRKFLVGLTTHMEESLERMERFFGWRYHFSPAVQEACRSTLLHDKQSNANGQNKKERAPVEGSLVWHLLERQNWYDLQLYDYIANVLFVEQAELVKDVPLNYRQVDATCCDCEEATFPTDRTYRCPVKVMD